MAWRLGLEFWNMIAWLLQYPPFAFLQRFDRPVGYFAFGANLDPQVLLRRRMRVKSQRELLLRDYALYFNQPGPFEGFGFASLGAAPGRCTYGRLLIIGQIDAIRMDYYEVLPFLGRHRRVWVEQDSALMYFYQATAPQEGLLPSREYLEKILVAAEQSPIIPQELLSELKSTPTLADLRPHPEPHFFLDDYGSGPGWLSDVRRHYDLLGITLFRRLYTVSIFSRWIRPQLPQEV